MPHSKNESADVLGAAPQRMLLTSQVAAWAALAAIYVGLVNTYAPESYMVRPKQHPCIDLAIMSSEIHS